MGASTSVEKSVRERHAQLIKNISERFKIVNASDGDDKYLDQAELRIITYAVAQSEHQEACDALTDILKKGKVVEEGDQTDTYQEVENYKKIMEGEKGGDGSNEIEPGQRLADGRLSTKTLKIWFKSYTWTMNQLEDIYHNLPPQPGESATEEEEGMDVKAGLELRMREAAKNGQENQVAKFVRTPNIGVDVNAPNEDGNTALHLAAAAGHEDVILVLLNLKADPTRENKDGEDPMTYGGKFGHVSAQLMEAML